MKINPLFELTSVSESIVNDAAAYFKQKYSEYSIPLVAAYSNQVSNLTVPARNQEDADAELPRVFQHIAGIILDENYDEFNGYVGQGFRGNKASLWLCWAALNIVKLDQNFEDLEMLIHPGGFEGYHSYITTYNRHSGLFAFDPIGGMMDNDHIISIGSLVVDVDTVVDQLTDEGDEEPDFGDYDSEDDDHVLYDQDDFKILQILSYQSAKHWSQLETPKGRNPSSGSWCTGWLGDKEYFDEYFPEGLLFVILDKKGQLLSDGIEAKYQCYLPNHNPRRGQEFKDHLNNEVPTSKTNNANLLVAMSANKINLEKTPGVPGGETLTAYIAKYNKKLPKDKQYFCIEDLFFARNCQPTVNDSAKKTITGSSAEKEMVDTYGISYYKLDWPAKAVLYSLYSDNMFSQFIADTLKGQLDFRVFGENYSLSAKLIEDVSYQLDAKVLLDSGGVHTRSVILDTYLDFEDGYWINHNFSLKRGDSTATTEKLFRKELIIVYMEKLLAEKKKDELTNTINTLYETGTLFFVVAFATKKELDRVLFIINQVPDQNSKRAQVKLNFPKEQVLLKTANLIGTAYDAKIKQFKTPILAYWYILLSNPNKIENDQASLSGLNKLSESLWAKLLVQLFMSSGLYTTKGLTSKQSEHEIKLIALLSQFRKVITKAFLTRLNKITEVEDDVFFDIKHAEDTYKTRSWLKAIAEAYPNQEAKKSLNFYGHYLNLLKEHPELFAGEQFIRREASSDFLRKMDLALRQLFSKLERVSPDTLSESERKVYLKNQEMYHKAKNLAEDIEAEMYSRVSKKDVIDFVFDDMSLFRKVIDSSKNPRVEVVDLISDKIGSAMYAHVSKMELTCEDVLDTLPDDDKDAIALAALFDPKDKEPQKYLTFKNKPYGRNSITVDISNSVYFRERAKTLESGYINKALDEIINKPKSLSISVHGKNDVRLSFPFSQEGSTISVQSDLTDIGLLTKLLPSFNKSDIFYVFMTIIAEVSAGLNRIKEREPSASERSKHINIVETINQSDIGRVFLEVCKLMVAGLNTVKRRQAIAIIALITSSATTLSEGSSGGKIPSHLQGQLYNGLGQVISNKPIGTGGTSSFHDFSLGDKGTSFGVEDLMSALRLTGATPKRSLFKERLMARLLELRVIFKSVDLGDLGDDYYSLRFLSSSNKPYFLTDSIVVLHHFYHTSIKENMLDDMAMSIINNDAVVPALTQDSYISSLALLYGKLSGINTDAKANQLTVHVKSLLERYKPE